MKLFSLIRSVAGGGGIVVLLVGSGCGSTPARTTSDPSNHRHLLVRASADNVGGVDSGALVGAAEAFAQQITALAELRNGGVITQAQFAERRRQLVEQYTTQTPEAAVTPLPAAVLPTASEAASMAAAPAPTPASVAPRQAPEPPPVMAPPSRPDGGSVADQAVVEPGGSIVIYARPAVIFLIPGGFKNAVGGSVALGCSFRRRDSVEFEAARILTKDPQYPEVSFSFTPVLANYDHLLWLGRFGFKVGVSAGCLLESAKVAYAGETYRWNSTAFAYGPRAGLAYSLSDRIALETDATVLRVAASELTDRGDVTVLRLGANLRF